MDKRFIDFRLDTTPGAGSYLVGHDTSGTEFRIAVSNLLSGIVIPEAQSIYVQYSANGSSWISSWTSGCKFMRIKIGSGAWSNAMAIAEVVNVYAQIKVGNTIVGGTVEGVELEAGSNVTLTPDAANKKIVISATGGGGSSVQSDWNQSDSSAADYIKNKPTIPNKTSDLTNDSGFLTQHQDISGKVDKVTNPTAGNIVTLDSDGNAEDSGYAPMDFQSDWNEGNSNSPSYIQNKPTIPSKTSDLTNDSGFLTQHQDISGKMDKVDNPYVDDVVILDADGNAVDSGYQLFDFQSNWAQTDSNAPDYISNKPTIPAAVSGQNDGTNWTQLTIGNETKAIPQGGSHLLNFGGYDLGPWAGDKTLTIIETIKRGYAKIQATGDLNLSLTIANTFENYILIYNSSASDIDITIAAVNSLSPSSIIMPDGGITVAAGKYCEISIYANSSYSVITASGSLE